MVFSLDIPSAVTLKAEAKVLRDAAARNGAPITHGAALEQVARQPGYRDWNTAVAALPTGAQQGFAIGQRVAGSYLKQPFTGTVLALALMPDMQHIKVTVQFDTPVDVVTSELFSAFRQRVTATVDKRGISPAKTSDGEPHMRVRGVR